MRGGVFIRNVNDKMNGTQEGEIKEIASLSPEAENRCIFCVEVILNKDCRIKLWHEDKKSKAGKEIEKSLGEQIKPWDLKVVCKGCLQKVRRVLSKINERRAALEKGRGKSSQYLTKRIKRSATDDENSDKRKKTKTQEKVLFCLIS